MPIIATSLGVGGGRNRQRPALRRLLNLVLPAANPDFESLYPSVQLWWVELNASGVPQREVGFSAGGEPIAVGPFGRNLGFWTDSPMIFVATDYARVEDRAFEQVWSSFEQQWNARHARNAA
jgi:hypothetical protein